MYRSLLIVVGAVLIAGCAGQTNGFLASSSAFLSRTGDALGNWGQSKSPPEYEAELKPLFEQPYIDPLTEYLHRHKDDPERAPQVAAVSQERDRRCATVAKRYFTDTITAGNLALYRRGYSFSCPEDVAAYRQKLKIIDEEAPKPADKVLAGSEQSETRASELPAPEGAVSVSVPGNEVAAGSIKSVDKREPKQDAPEQGPAVSQQLSDCYLLTRIRNFTAALKACKGPAKNGIVGAQTNMAQILDALGRHEQAYRWAQRAAPESGVAANLLGEMYAQGRGVAQDDAAAAKWFRIAAEQGYAGAEASLATVISGTAVSGTAVSGTAGANAK